MNFYIYFHVFKSLLLNFFRNIEYRIIIKIIGNKEIEIFLAIESEINLIVVSEKIIKNRPAKNVVKRSFENDIFSLEDVISKKGTSIKIGI